MQLDALQVGMCFMEKNEDILYDQRSPGFEQVLSLAFPPGHY